MPSDCTSLECLLKGLHLRISYYQWPLYMTLGSDDETGNPKVMGLYPEYILPFLLGSLNITYEYILSDVIPYGLPKINGTWPGDLGILQAKDADISIGPHYLDYDRYVEFSAFDSYQRLSLKFLASVGKMENFDFFSFLYQTENMIWCLFIMSMGIIWFCSSLSDTLMEKCFTCDSLLQNLNRCFWIYLASVFCEGSPRTLRSWRGQLLQFLWLFTIFVLVNVFYSQFKGILMIRYDDSYMGSMEDLAKRPDITPLILRDSIMEKMLKESPYKSYRTVYQNALRRKDQALGGQSQQTDLEVFENVKKGTHVLFTVVLFCKYMINIVCPILTGNRMLHFIDEEVGIMDMIIVANKDFPHFLKNLIDGRIHRMTESGVLDKWTSYYFKDFEKCQQQSEDEELLLQLKHMTNAFHLYLTLLGLSTAIFCLELLRKNKIFNEN